MRQGGVFWVYGTTTPPRDPQTEFFGPKILGRGKKSVGANALAALARWAPLGIFQGLYFINNGEQLLLCMSLQIFPERIVLPFFFYLGQIKLRSAMYVLQKEG